MDNIVQGMPFEDYSGEEGLNASALSRGVKSMLHMHHSIHEEIKDTPAMRWGRIIHGAILEPEVFADKCVTYGGKTRRGKEWEAFKADNEGKEILTASEGADLAALAQSVLRNKEVTDLLTECQREVSIFWSGEYGKAKGRLDAYNPDVCIVDLKTTGDVTPSAFTNVAARLGYHLRLAWYRTGIEVLTGNRLPVYVIVVEQKPPYDSYVMEYDQTALGVGADQAVDIAMQYRACEKEGYFPGVQDGIGTLYLPRWMVTEHVNDMEEVEASEL